MLNYRRDKAVSGVIIGTATGTAYHYLSCGDLNPNNAVRRGKPGDAKEGLVS